MLAALAADRGRIADIEAQILLLGYSPVDLQSEKQLAQERLDSYTYPVLTLANEIVGEIFVHALPVYPLCPPLTGPGSPTLLAQICYEWREIALSTPTLWRAISLNTSCDEVCDGEVDLCNLWLSRSRCCPLSLDLDEAALGPLRATELLSALVQHRARWEHLNHFSKPPARLRVQCLCSKV
ncbi:hypothetical protein B0H14DRAFT_629369 [Mycena olivaceomarginata]|nr:hypothetical protein B0H14DRAFT_629369 [Mycena olivaceomarginata]